MSSTKNTQEVKSVLQPARLFIGLTVLSGAAVAGWVAFGVRAWPHLQVLKLAAARRMKGKFTDMLPFNPGSLSFSREAGNVIASITRNDK